MTNLIDGIFGLFDNVGKFLDNYRFQADLNVLNGLQTKDQVLSWVTAMRQVYPNDPRVDTAAAAALQRVAGQKDRGILGGAAEALYRGFADLSGEIGPLVSGGLQGGLVAAAAPAEALTGAVIQPIVDMVVHTLESGGQSVPADVRSKLAGVLMPVLSLGLTMEIATDLAELIHPMKNMGLSGVSHFLYDTVGFKALTESYVYPIRRCLIEDPTNYNINRLIQPRYISPGEARVLVWKRLMTDDKFADILRVHGVREEFVPALQEDVWRDLNMRDLQRFYDVDTVPDDFAMETIRKIGYKETNVPVLLKALKKRVLVKEFGDIRALQRNQYKNGVIDATAYLDMLQGRGVTGTDAQDLIKAVEAERDYDAKEEDRALYEKKFLDGRATEAELRAALALLGKLPAWVDSRIKRLTEQKLGKLKAEEAGKVLSRADYVKQYNQGTLTKAAANKALDDTGYSAGDAMVITDLEDKDAAEAVTAEWVRAYELKARNLRMTPAELKAAYISLGKSDAWATARLAYVTEQVQGKETVTTTETAV